VCINTFACLKINQYSTGLFVSYSRKNPIVRKIVYFFQSALVHLASETSSPLSLFLLVATQQILSKIMENINFPKKTESRPIEIDFSSNQIFPFVDLLMIF